MTLADRRVTLEYLSARYSYWPEVDEIDLKDAGVTSSLSVSERERERERETVKGRADGRGGSAVLAL